RDLIDHRAEYRVDGVGGNVGGLAGGKHDLVVVLGAARQKDQLEAERLTPIGDGKPEQIAVEAFHRMDVLDAEAEVAEPQTWRSRCCRAHLVPLFLAEGSASPGSGRAALCPHRCARPRAGAPERPDSTERPCR